MAKSSESGQQETHALQKSWCGPSARSQRLVDDLVEKSGTPVTKVLDDAGVKASQVDEVVLVGGMTRLPLVQQLVKRAFDKSQ